MISSALTVKPINKATTTDINMYAGMFSFSPKHVAFSGVHVGVVKAHQVGQDKCQQWGFNKINEQVLGVGEFAFDVPR
jgi:hypothetical protein